MRMCEWFGIHIDVAEGNTAEGSRWPKEVYMVGRHAVEKIMVGRRKSTKSRKSDVIVYAYVLLDTDLGTHSTCINLAFQAR